jgi:purine-binding chemotaxis protein CheW
MKMGKTKKPATVEEDVVQLVTFRVGREEYGLEINSITEVVRPLKISSLPRMPRFIEGVVNLRGVIIPVVDLRKRFALAEIHDDPKKMRMMITKGAAPASARGANELLGLIVDRVLDVLDVRRKDISPAPDAATGDLAELISGMGKVGERLVILLDLTRLLSRQERKELAEAESAED